jgi:regulatory protein
MAEKLKNMGKITEIKSGNRRSKRVNIFIDGRFALALDSDLVIKERLMVNAELEPDRIENLVKIDEIQRGFNSAVRYVGYRPRSEAELRNRLERRGFSADIIDKVVSRLKEQGLVDDIAFARFWTENRESFRPRSQSLTALELKQKGITSEIIKQSVSAIDDEDSAYHVALTKTRRLENIDYLDFRKRISGYLQRSGFSYEIIRRTIEKIWQERGKQNSPDLFDERRQK